MNSIAHWLGGLAFTGRPDLFVLIYIFSKFPDLLSAPFFFYYVIKAKYPIKHSVLFEWKPPKEYLEYYRFFHSILGLFLIASVFNVFFPQHTKIFLLCYLSHIVIDMFSHGGFWATRIFYPFSDFHLGFTKNHWQHKFTRRTIFAILIIININILLRYKIF